MSEAIYTRDVSSGRIHKRFLVGDGPEVASFEGCNLDDAGEAVVIDEQAVADAEYEVLCGRCFPPKPMKAE